MIYTIFIPELLSVQSRLNPVRNYSIDSKDNMVRWLPIPGKVIAVMLRVILYWKIYDITKAAGH